MLSLEEITPLIITYMKGIRKKAKEDQRRKE